MSRRPTLLCCFGIAVAFAGYALTLLALGTLFVERSAQPFVLYLAMTAPATAWAGYDLYEGRERARVTALIGALPFLGFVVDELFRAAQVSLVPLAVALIIALTPHVVYRRTFRAKSDLLEVFR